jgi:hypothetical protein
MLMSAQCVFCQEDRKLQSSCKLAQVFYHFFS